jgi:hypothetical protein
MSKFTIAGLVSWFAGGLIFTFQAIGGLVSSGGDLVWKNLTLMDVIGKSRLDWIAGMPDGITHNIAQYIVTMPLSLLLFCVGALFFILGQFTSKL